ncbi:MAG: hypothetical protein QOG23_1752 [Blastocatellia bacterium]|jgi:hypothetical protein|nr:hypothetical protein [Blastocatellia bacterium]
MLNSPIQAMLDEIRNAEKALTVFFLAQIFDEHPGVTPDIAITELQRRMSLHLAKVLNVPNWTSAIEMLGFRLYPLDTFRQARHVAVDLYHGVPFSRAVKHNARLQSRPPIPYTHLIRVAYFALRGWQAPQIARELGWPMDTKEEQTDSLSYVRKHLEAARKRLPEITMQTPASRRDQKPRRQFYSFAQQLRVVGKKTHHLYSS